MRKPTSRPQKIIDFSLVLQGVLAFRPFRVYVSFWYELGRILQSFWVHHGPSGRHLGPIWPHLGTSGAILVPSWRHVRSPWANVGRILAHLGCILAHLGSPWRHLGVILAHLGPILAHLGPSWLTHLGPILAYLGAILPHPGPILVPSWTHLGLSWPHLGVLLAGLVTWMACKAMYSNSSMKSTNCQQHEVEQADDFSESFLLSSYKHVQ